MTYPEQEIARLTELLARYEPLNELSVEAYRWVKDADLRALLEFVGPVRELVDTFEPLARMDCGNPRLIDVGGPDESVVVEAQRCGGCWPCRARVVLTPFEERANSDTPDTPKEKP